MKLHDISLSRFVVYNVIFSLFASPMRSLRLAADTVADQDTSELYCVIDVIITDMSVTTHFLCNVVNRCMHLYVCKL